MSKIFPVSTSDAAWAHVVRTLLPRADCIAIDLSELRASVTRELEFCAELSLLDRVVCVARDTDLASVRARLDADPRWRQLVVSGHDDAGVVDEGTFARAIEAALLYDAPGGQSTSV